MREQYRGVDYLDFWLDVIHHLSLCRHYVRGLRQSIMASSEIDGSSRASSVLLDTLIQDGVLDDTDSHRLSAFLRGEDPANNGTLYRLSALLDAMNSKEQGIADLHAPASRTDNFISRVNANANANANANINSNSNTRRTPSGNVITKSLPHNDGELSDDEYDENGMEREKLYSRNEPIAPGPSSGFRGVPDDAYDEESFYSFKNQSGSPVVASPTGAYAPRAGTPQARNSTNTNPFRNSRVSTSSSARYNALNNSSPNSAARSSPSRGQVPGFSANVTNAPTSNLSHFASPPNIHNSSGQGSRASAAETIERLFPRRAGDITDGTNYVTRQDIRQSSHRILVTYFMPGAEKEIVMPDRILKAAKHAIEVEGRDDPEVFDEAREYAFQAMEREAFPSFLAARALGNLTPTGSLIRLIVGLVALFAAFWIAFVFILLDWKPKVTRLWLILPAAVAAYGIFSSLYNLDPLMALAGFSEASARSVVRIKEPYVRQLLTKRSLYVLCVLIIVTACFVLIFALVPGHRL
ncbi:Rax1p [Sugiyamaella lignohabitans]|uniref:Rax1p n=1 Tax=Sugiyamaella lignohabitans TaxID=796027 RepID=A0A167CCF2_9ASCO|nr:Rax1p [Sugiyamaella lignohabitans]ANB11504.1 Rax1p [Sugiyamaella lignohabitans]